MMRPADRDLTNGDVTLLFGIPVNYDEFISRIKTSDWLSKFYDRNEDPTNSTEVIRERWEREYAPLVGDALQELIKTAISLGVDVHLSATLDDLSQATSMKQIVILFAHWKGPEILNDDFIYPPDKNKFKAKAETAHSHVAYWLCSRLAEVDLPRCAPQHLSWASITKSVHRIWQSNQSVRDVLNEALHVTLPEHSQEIGADEVVEHEVTRSARRRGEIDTIFSDLLRPGNRLELFDGLHSKEQIEIALAPAFCGILDLTTCTSTVLADYINRKRRQEVRTVQFSTIQEFLWCAKCVTETLKLVANMKLPYLRARIAAGTALEQSVKQIAGK